MPATTPPNKRRLFASDESPSDVCTDPGPEKGSLESCFSFVIGPKRNELIEQTGRAPMVKMSRMIPPTPVVAPWNGSTALGWLWDSILKAIASPSPISNIPAFSSPAPTRILGDLVGKVLSKRRLFLYEQCSLHITEKMPNSV